ncbi:MAG: thiamine phosphate synthase [Planctomycetaceae bacterium]|nr:thiamine phosphate synthase [Planctomycetaceae bacterium]
MRFDLTNASYRVLDRASKYRLPAATSEISAAKILIALFEEEESRAADWLVTAGLSLEKFYTEFGIREHIATLQSPISAPSFPVGYYGIPTGLPAEPNRADSPEIEASPAGNNAPSIGRSDSETLTDGEHKKIHEPNQENEPVTDTWNQSNSPTNHRTYSIYSQYRNDNSEPNFQSRIRFYLDDQPVHPGRISKQLESALEIILHRFFRQDIRMLPIQTGGGITTISSRKTVAAFSLATEHLLLAVVLDDSDVGLWLRDHGFDPTELYRRIDGIGNDHSVAPETTEPIFDETVSPAQNEFSRSDESLEIVTSVSLTDDKIYRLLDAAANRGKEAVRVVEDFVRFILDHPELTRRLKDFRHEFQNILNSFPTRSRLAARNTEYDVGTALEGNSEYRRDSADSVLAANFGRLQESLRSLEEFSKLVKPEISRRFEQLRYQCYTLQKNVTLNDFSPLVDSFRQIDSSPFSSVTKPDISTARLYVLTDIRADEEEFATFIRTVLNGGADVIQLRDKKADDRTLLCRSRILKEQITASGRSVLFVMNDRPDLARLADADGVHVGQEELPVEAVRRIVGTGMLVGVSTHCIEQARQAVSDGADYIGAGPVFETPTKEFAEIAGIHYLQEIVAEIQIPVFAIGGITAENLDTVLAAGIKRVAVGSFLLQASDPQKTATELKNRLL